MKSVRLNSNILKVASSILVIFLAVSCGEEKKKESKSVGSQIKDPIRTTPINQNPVQNPTTRPDESWNGCGDSLYCDRGNGVIELPASASNIVGGFNAEDVRACMRAVSDNNIPTYGPWTVSGVQRSFTIGDQNFTIGADDSVANPYAGNIVMLNIFGALSTQDIMLDAPNTVYCVKSSMYFSAVTYKSCYPNNVIFLDDNKWLAANRYVVPTACGGTPIWNRYQ